MSTKFSKEELKSPDQVTQTLREGFVWTTTHSKLVFGALGAFVVLGLTLSLLSYFKEKKEVTQQEKYFILEKNYIDTKRGFEVIPATDKAPASGKKASGDLQTDYGTVVANFETFIGSDVSSKAAQMAALNLSDIYMTYKKNDEALTALKKVESGLDKSDMITALIWMQMGNAMANKSDCKGAIAKWDELSKVKALAFAHDEAKLRTGLCYEAMNDVAMAEQIYTEISKNNTSGSTAATQEALKYLRVLKAKKNL